MDGSVEDPIDLSHTRRRLWVIILLTLLGGAFPFVYCGQLGRAIRWQVGLWLFGLLVLAAMLYTPFVRVAIVVTAIGAVVVCLTIIIFAWKTQQVLPWKPYQKWWCYLLLYMAFYFAGYCLTSGVQEFWCEAVFCTGRSMKNTMLDGDRILIDKLAFRVNQAKRQSLVSFRALEYPQRHAYVNYVKRLIAVGGDRVAIKDDQVFVNGQALEEPYANYENKLGRFYQEKMEQFAEQVVPPGYAFVLGDNRWHSIDSRFFGFIPYADFIGEAKCVYWSQEDPHIVPDREFPSEREVFGSIRWQRIGQQLH